LAATTFGLGYFFFPKVDALKKIINDMSPIEDPQEKFQDLFAFEMNDKTAVFEVESFGLKPRLIFKVQI